MATRSIKTKFEVDGEKAYQKSIADIGKSLANLKASYALVTAAVVAVTDAYKKLINMTTEAAANADQILTLSQITGFDTQSIQEFQYAAELIDVSFETITGSITKMKRNMDSARDGSSSMQESFSQLGVSITNADGTLRNANDVFYEAIDALGDIGNETERDALSMSIFGKSAQELNPLIVQGTEVLKEYQEEAEAVGAVLSGQQLEALGEVDNAYQRLQNTQKAIKEQMAAELAPAVEELYTGWTSFIQTAAQALIDSGIIGSLGDILGIVEDLVQPLTWLFSTALPAISDAMKKITDIVYQIKTSAIGAELERIMNVLNFFTGDPATVLGVFKGQGEMKPVNEWNAPGDRNFEGGWTWVGENGAELVNLPRGSQILNAQESRNMSGDTYYITIDAKNVREFNDVVRIMQNSKSAARRHA